MRPGFNEHRAVSLVRQELAGEGGLARAVGGGDDDNALVHRKESSQSCSRMFSASRLVWET